MKKINIFEKLYTFSEWVMFLAWLNILWVLFTLLGAVIFGWAPATAASFAVMKKVFEEKTLKLPISKLFFGEYKKYFLRGNYIGYSIAVVAAFIIFGIFTLPSLPTVAFFILSVFYGAVVSMCLVTALYSFPVLVNYDTSYVETFKMALFVGIAHLNHVIVLGVFLFVSYIVFMAFPGTMIFFLISLPTYIISKYSEKSFNRIEKIAKKDGVVNGQE